MKKQSWTTLIFIIILGLSGFLFSCSDDDSSWSKSWSYSILHPEGKCWYSQARSLHNKKVGGIAAYRGSYDVFYHGVLWPSFSSAAFEDISGGYQDNVPSQIFAIGAKGAVGETAGYQAYWQDFNYPIAMDFPDSTVGTAMAISGNWVAGNAQTVYNDQKSALWRINDDNTKEAFDITPDEAPLAAWAMAIQGSTSDNPGVVAGAGCISTHKSDAILWKNFVLDGKILTFDYVNLHPSEKYWASECWAAYGGSQGGYVQEPPEPDDPFVSEMRVRAALWKGTPESFQNLHPDLKNAKNSRIRGMADGIQVGEVFFGDNILQDPECHAFLWYGSADDYVDLHSILPDNYSSSHAFSVEKNGDEIYVAGSAINDNADMFGREEAVVWIYSTDQKELSAQNWVEATASAGFPAREAFTVEVFDHKLWVIGGFDHDTVYSDVWYSSDGITWQQATENAAFGKRFAHSSVVFDDKLWVIAGSDENSNSYNDAWCSTDGVNWTQVTANAGFPVRYAHTSVASYNQMWVIGGRSGDDAMNDVWVSQNGSIWTQLTAEAEFNPRQNHASVYFNNKLWVVGGISTPLEENIMLSDVWSSLDGVSWTKQAEDAFEGRETMALVAAEGEMWMLGGFMNPHSRANQVWHSVDGVSWNQVSLSAGFTPRCNLGGAYFKDKLWIMGGQTGPSSRVNDVWYAD